MFLCSLAFKTFCPKEELIGKSSGYFVSLGNIFVLDISLKGNVGFKSLIGWLLNFSVDTKFKHLAKSSDVMTSAEKSSSGSSSSTGKSHSSSLKMTCVFYYNFW